MLSKQQKQHYGEILRKQMKQKEQRKKFEDMQKRGQNNRIPHHYSQPQKQQVYYQPTIMQKQNPNIPRPYLDPKEQLQRKFEGPQYNYFGGLGGGALNRRDLPNRNVNSMQNGLRMPPDEMMDYSNNNNRNYGQGYPQPLQRGPPRLQTQQNERNYYQNDSVSPPTLNYQNNPKHTNDNNYYSENPLASNRINYNPYQQGQSSQPYPDREPQPVSYDLIPGVLNNSNNNSKLIDSYSGQGNNSYQQNANTNTSIAQVQQRQLYQQIEQPQMMSPQIRNGVKQAQELMQVYRKGGRNLLKLENQTIDQHLIKQKRKLQIQKQLKQQIQQAQRKKKQQKQRIQREQQQDERKQQLYIAQQKRKFQQQQRKQRQQRQKIIDDNVKNLQRKKQMQLQAKNRVKIQQKQRMDKRQAQQQRIKHEQEKTQLMKKNQLQQMNNNYTNEQLNNAQLRNRNLTDDDNMSVLSSEISTLQKGYSTNLPKEFFMKQRQRINPSKKFQSLTYQVQKMQDQIRKQGQIFNKEMYKVKQDAQRALIDKRRADEEIERLKKELKKKMDDDNDKLLKALQSNDYRNQYGMPEQQSSNNYGYNNNHNNQNNHNNHNNQNSHYNQNGYNNVYGHSNRQQQQQYQQNFNKNTKNYQSYDQPEEYIKKPLKQKQSQKLIREDYQPRRLNSHEEEYQNFNQSNAGLVSLDGDSKHIPMNLPNAHNLTISQVQNFAKDSSYFQKNLLNKNSPKKMPKYDNKNYENQSIPEEQNQQRDYGMSRKSNRNTNNNNMNNNMNNNNNNNNIKSSKQIIQSKDELDRLMDSRAKSRGGWGQMSSVNSDITKEIEDLLRNKGQIQKSQQRPNSISNAGRQSLARQGYAYDGLTINSNVGTLNDGGTLDIERINGRNDARIRQLRNLGVQTINTNGDDDLGRLDQLLNKYN